MSGVYPGQTMHHRNKDHCFMQKVKTMVNIVGFQAALCVWDVHVVIVRVFIRVLHRINS